MSKFFYVMGKALPGKLSCNGTGLVIADKTDLHISVVILGEYTSVL